MGLGVFAAWSGGRLVREDLHRFGYRMSLAAFANKIRLFANPLEPGCDNMPPTRPPLVDVVAVVEFVLGAQMVLRQHLRVGLELFGTDRFPCHAVEDLR